MVKDDLSNLIFEEPGSGSGPDPAPSVNNLLTKQDLEQVAEDDWIPVTSKPLSVPLRLQMLLLDTRALDFKRF